MLIPARNTLGLLAPTPPLAPARTPLDLLTPIPLLAPLRRQGVEALATSQVVYGTHYIKHSPFLPTAY